MIAVTATVMASRAIVMLAKFLCLHISTPSADAAPTSLGGGGAGSSGGGSSARRGFAKKRDRIRKVFSMIFFIAALFLLLIRGFASERPCLKTL